VSGIVRLVAAFKLAWLAFRMGLAGWTVEEFEAPNQAGGGRVFTVNLSRANWGLGAPEGWKVSSGGATFQTVYPTATAAARGARRLPCQFRGGVAPWERRQ